MMKMPSRARAKSARRQSNLRRPPRKGFKVVTPTKIGTKTPKGDSNNNKDNSNSSVTTKGSLKLPNLNQETTRYVMCLSYVQGYMLLLHYMLCDYLFC